MRKSNAVILFAFGLLVVLIIAGVLVTRLTLGGLLDQAQSSDNPAGAPNTGDWTDKTFGLEGFSGIRAGGAWHIRLKQDDDYKVSVRMPADMTEQVIVRIHGDLLELDMKPGIIYAGLAREADISLPRITVIEASGGAEFELTGFKGGSLKVDATGAVKLHGKDNRFTDFSLDSSGASQVRLMGNPTVNADLNLSGASDVELTMAGGNLSGSVSGAGKVIYDGEVTVQNVDVSGIGMVRRR